MMMSIFAILLAATVAVSQPVSIWNIDDVSVVHNDESAYESYESSEEDIPTSAASGELSPSEYTAGLKAAFVGMHWVAVTLTNETQKFQAYLAMTRAYLSYVTEHDIYTSEDFIVRCDTIEHILKNYGPQDASYGDILNGWFIYCPGP